MNNTETLLENYSKRLSSKGALRAQYIRYAADFLNYSDGELSRESVEGYIKKLKAQGEAEGTINFKFRLIRTIFTRNPKVNGVDVEWPFNRGEAPRVTKAKLIKPSYGADLVLKFIESARENGTPDEKAFLAISTTYGLRRTELVHLGPQDVLIKERLLHIATAKHGEERHHMIPEEIVPYLWGWDFNTKVSDTYMTILLHRIEYRAGQPHIDRAGWHSVRRRLNTSLRKVLDRDKVVRFLRWTGDERESMSDTYIADTSIGLNGAITHEAINAVQSDSEVFAVHPFLKAWE